MVKGIIFIYCTDIEKDQQYNVKPKKASSRVICINVASFFNISIYVTEIKHFLFF